MTTSPLTTSPAAAPGRDALAAPLDAVARGAAALALFLLAAALLALGFSTTPRDATLALAGASPLDIEATAPEHAAPALEVP